MKDLSYCGEMVRRHDPDRFLLSMYMPADVRQDLWALYALNHEIARTREVVTDTQLGLIRLQWWRETVVALCDGRGVQNAGPVAEALSKTISRHSLPRGDFEQLVYAREFDLEDRMPATLDGMAQYARLTAAPLMSLATRVCGSGDDVSPDIAAGYALTGLLRALPVHLGQRRCYLPENLVAGRVEDWFAARGLEALPEIVAQVAGRARALLEPAGGASAVGSAHRALALMYLGQIKRLKYNVFSPRMALPPVGREARLWWALRRAN